MSAKRDAVAIVGAGGLARAMARALSRSGGAVVVVASRRPEAAAAHALLVRCKVPEREALAALARLTLGAVETVRRSGLHGALTGPVARNDAGTLEAQLSTLAVFDPAAALAHRALSLRLIELAESSGRLDHAAANALRRRLARGPGRSRTV